MVNSLEHVDVGYDDGCITLWIYQNPLNCKFFFFYSICSEFCHTLKWKGLGFTCLPHPDPPSLNCKFLRVSCMACKLYFNKTNKAKKKKSHSTYTFYICKIHMWECGSLGESGALSGDISLNIYGCCWKSLQSCPTLCDPIDGSPSGSPIPGILQARILEWVAISFWLLYWTTQRQVQCGWNLDWQKADWRRGKSDEVLNDDNVAKMAG